ncbi:MAG: excinuclease ABC subunit C [Bacteroidaceae bacterium]|nr:excinuclease ABC subunit C [Bacteroidaceae bacterium]
MNKNFDRIKLLLKTIPETPGVYRYYDDSGNVLYVGKARNLKRRVSSYFSHFTDLSPKIRILVRKIYDIKYIIVENETDALLLENNLIKQLQPKYNSMLKDDKSYPSLCITAEPYPRLLFTRDRSTIKGTFYGPYPNQKILRELQDIIRRLFCYRTCKLNLTPESIRQGKFKACINSQIGLCKAPCVADESREEYLQTIEMIRNILKGDFKEIIDDLKKQMLDYAERLEFEQAEAVKQKIILLEQYQSRSLVVDTSIRDVDVFSIMSDDKHAYINIMRIKNGGIIHSYSTEVKKQLDESDEEILSMVIPELHTRVASTAKEIIVPFKVDIPDDYLLQSTPTRGDRKKLLELSIRNIKHYQHERTQQRLLVEPEGNKLHVLEKIQSELHLPELPRHIECFDNSNIQGAFPVAAMVHFADGKPCPAEYRHYNIKTVEGPDDYASMEEVVFRRYKRLKDENKPLPQLIIVDGGKGQMEAIRQIVEDELHLDIPIAGLVKDGRHRTTELIVGRNGESIGLKQNSALFRLMTQIQDEVHRFAITFHRDKRSKRQTASELDTIKGIGEKSKQALLTHFKSVKRIKAATHEEVAKIIGESKAQTVLAALNRQEE